MTSGEAVTMKNQSRNRTDTLFPLQFLNTIFRDLCSAFAKSVAIQITHPHKNISNYDCTAKKQWERDGAKRCFLGLSTRKTHNSWFWFFFSCRKSFFCFVHIHWNLVIGKNWLWTWNVAEVPKPRRSETGEMTLLLSFWKSPTWENWGLICLYGKIHPKKKN